MSISVNHQNFSNVSKLGQNTLSPKNSEVAFTSKESDNKTSNKAFLYAALTALAAGGIFIATRGKKGFPVNLSHLDMDLFKQFGKFEKGKAVFYGKDFNGRIFTKNNCELIYSDGYLTKSIGPNGTKYYDKGKLYRIDHNYRTVGAPKTTLVERQADGTRIITKMRGGFDNKYLDLDQYGTLLKGDKNHDIVTTIKPDGTVTRLTRNLETYAHGLEQKYTYDKLEHLNFGKRELIKKGVESSNYYHIPMRQQKIVDGKKVTEELNQKGEVIKSWTTEFNPKNNVSSQIITEKGKVPITIFRDKQGNVLEKCGSGENIWYHFWNDNNPKMAQFSTENPYAIAIGVSKEQILELIKKEGLPFEV